MPPFERQVLDSLPLTVYTVDLEGRITSANRSWSRFAVSNGAPELADERSLVGQSIFDAVADPLARAQVERAMQLLRAGRAPTLTWEFPCSSPDVERVFLMQISPLRESADADPGMGRAADAPADGRLPTPDSRISGFVFSTVDITASHKSREALIDTGIALSRTIALDRVFTEVGQQLRRAVGCDAFAIAVADETVPDGGTPGDASALRVVHQFGFDDPAGHTVNAAVLERELAPVWRESLESGRVLLRHAERGLELTAPMTSAQGALGAITVLGDAFESPQRLDEAERVLATLAAQTSVAIERARLVRRVEHKRRLEAIGEVAAGVAHELRNPLFGISSAAQLLRFRTKEDPVVEKNVGRILREVERLNRMVTALLEYGRPNPLHATVVDPDAVWDEVLESQRGLLESRALLLRRTRAERPGHCLVDAEQLAQVFVNVLVNAVDAAPEASDLTLTSTTTPHGGWRCRLTNGGPPIPAEALARAFEIFFSTKTGGTGIGLALCQRIVDEHGGTIALESTAECGTTVTITLPAAAEADGRSEVGGRRLQVGGGREPVRRATN